MNRFAELLDALLFTPSRNGKLRLMREYFATTPDPERGWALAALTGGLGFPEAKPGQVRDLAMARVDPVLFGWSWDFVGDLAETVALIWPERPWGENPQPPPAGVGGPPFPQRERGKLQPRPRHFLAPREEVFPR
jgi:DNA ligase-1